MLIGSGGTVEAAKPIFGHVKRTKHWYTLVFGRGMLLCHYPLIEKYSRSAHVILLRIVNVYIEKG